MEDHDDGHGQCDDVYGARGHLEDDGVRQFDIAGVAVWLDADAAVYRGDGSDGRAQGQRCRLAEGCEVAERHLDGLAPNRPEAAPDRVVVVLDARVLEENFGEAEGRVDFRKAGDEPKLVRGGPQRSNPEPDRSFPRARTPSTFNAPFPAPSSKYAWAMCLTKRLKPKKAELVGRPPCIVVERAR